MKFPKIRRRHLHHGGLVLAGLVAAIVFFVIGAVLRLLIGPVSLAPFSTQLSESIARSLPGIQVKFNQAALEWSRSEKRVNVVILGARVYDSRNRVVAQAPKAAIDLAAGPFFRGEIAVQRITLIGVQLTMVRTKDGMLRLGVEGGHGTSDVLQRLTEDIARQSNASSLRSFAVRNASVAFLGQASGLFVVAPQASLSVTNTGSKNNPMLEANVDAAVEVSGRRSHVVAAMRLPGGSEPATGNFSVRGFNLKGLGLNAPAFAALKNTDLSLDMSGNFSLEHGTRLRSADLSVTGAGTINDPRLPGGPAHVSSLTALVHYDGSTGRVLISDASLVSNHARAHLRGQGQVEVDANGLLTRVEADLDADDMMLNIPGFLPRPVTFKRVALRAGYVPSTGEMDFEHVGIAGGPLSVDVSGKIVFAQTQTPEIDVQGKIGAIDVRDLLLYWPMDMAAGARAWIDENMSAGRVGPVTLVTHIPMGALSGAALPENDVNLSFAISGASATYVKGLTPITGGQGTALLTGDTFKLDLGSARVGPLSITNGHVVIADLHSPDAVGAITAHVEGAVPDALALIDMKPLQYPTRFGIKPAETKGTASIDLDFRVPMIKDESVDSLGISVKAAIGGLALALGPHTQIADGNATLTVSSTALHAVGTASVGGARMALDWTEDFKPSGPFSTSLSVNAQLDEAARKALGLDMSDYLEGPVGLSAKLQGRHGKIVQGNVSLDLTPTALDVRLIDYKKPSGAPANAQFRVHVAPDGAMSADSLRLSGSGLQVTGSAALDANGKIVALDLPAVRAGPLNDFSVKLTRNASTGLSLSASGRSFDAATILDETSKGGNPSASESQEHFRISAQFNTLYLKNRVALAPFVLTVSGVGDRPDTLSLVATMPKNQKVSAGITADASGRKLTIQTPDAGTLIRGLLDFKSMKGGQLDASITFPSQAGADPPGDAKPVDFEGTVTIDNFKITNQPFLVRLFSAGSLEGIANLLQEQGIGFDKMVVPFSANNGMISISEARAAGPSLGVTAQGYIDRTRDQVSVGGTLAPIYGINGLLGSIPVLGNILVSKQGEGVIGMTYSVSGNAEEPDVSVNPLSVLTPGIFRRIFEGTRVPPPPLQSSNTGSQPVPAPKPGG